jgi:hypothetical protein
MTARAGRAPEWAPIVLAIALIAAVAATFAIIGGDAWWLAALGRTIVEQHSIPTGVPFAVAPSSHWHNVPVLAELSFHGLEAGLGDRGLMAAQLVAVTAAFTLLALDAAGPPWRTFAVLLVATGGTLSSLVVIRVQLFSLVLFPLLALLLRREARHPSRAIWAVPVLLALWSNLHGVVLAGLALTIAYLLLDRVRIDPRTAVCVAILSVAALLVTPALLGTVSYYRGLVTNSAAQHAIGFWARLSPGRPLDVVTIAALGVLAVLVLQRRARPRLWELVAIAGLAVATLDAARSATWLAFFLVPLAARGERRRQEGTGWPLAVGVSVALVAAACYGLARGPATLGTSHGLVQQAIRTAGGTAILAPDAVAEQVARAGGTIWLGNPIDAFAKRDQTLYIEWLQGKPSGAAALDHALVVLVRTSSPAGRLVRADHRFRLIDHSGRVGLYVRPPS